MLGLERVPLRRPGLELGRQRVPLLLKVTMDDRGTTTDEDDVLINEAPSVGDLISVPVDADGDGKVNDKGERQKMTLKVGDRVLFTSYAGTEVKYQGEEFLIMSENDVLAVINA